MGDCVVHNVPTRGELQAPHCSSNVWKKMVCPASQGVLQGNAQQAPPAAQPALASGAAQSERRIEVIANGLPLWGGAQLAVDTTLVSPRDRGITAGAASGVAERAKARAYPELAQDNRCRLVVLGIEVGGGGPQGPLSSSDCWPLARGRARAAPVATQAATASAFALALVRAAVLRRCSVLCRQPSLFARCVALPMSTERLPS